MIDDSRNQAESAESLTVCNAVLEEVAETVGVSALELSPPLYDVVDTEALENLFDRDGNHHYQPDIKVEFTYSDCRVTVHSNGEVTATRLDE